MFVFLALAFGIGFVAFGIGGTGGSGISDLFQNAGSATGGRPWECQGQDRRRQPRRVQGALGAYRAENKPEEAIAAGEQYVEERDRRTTTSCGRRKRLRGGQARLREAAEIVQEDLTAKTGGTTFGLNQNTLLGRALGQGKIDQELTAASQTLTEQYSGIQKAYTRATQLYQKNAAVATPDDVL